MLHSPCRSVSRLSALVNSLERSTWQGRAVFEPVSKTATKNRDNDASPDMLCYLTFHFCVFCKTEPLDVLERGHVHT